MAKVSLSAVHNARFPPLPCNLDIELDFISDGLWMKPMALIWAACCAVISPHPDYSKKLLIDADVSG